MLVNRRTFIVKHGCWDEAGAMAVAEIQMRSASWWTSVDASIPTVADHGVAHLVMRCATWADS
jgi:hypothetical protein